MMDGGLMDAVFGWSYWLAVIDNCGDRVKQNFKVREAWVSLLSLIIAMTEMEYTCRNGGIGKDLVQKSEITCIIEYM
jgi:hypothetical protein